ncbi:DNA nucleotidylexotransferase-like isoform X2 [Antedon mediterranea]
MQWFVDCMETESALPVTDKYRLPSERKDEDKNESSTDERNVEKTEYKNAKYACQRSTPFHHPNRKLTDALEVLEKHAEFLTDDQNNARALAFRKATAALKAYPSEIKMMNQVENLKDLKGGQHCKQVIQEILDEGFCSEVERIAGSEWYKVILMFTGVFGCGPVTAKKWFDKGCRSLEDVKKHFVNSLSREQKIGIEYYSDLNTPVRQKEAELIRQIVCDEAVRILPETTVTITGGFSRGKEYGHDVDLLISHPEESKEADLLHKLLNKLKSLNLLLYTSTKENNYSESMYSTTEPRKGHMDHYARCFSVFKLSKSAAAVSDINDVNSENKKNSLDNISKAKQSTEKDISDNALCLNEPIGEQSIRDQQIREQSIRDQPINKSDTTITNCFFARRVDLIFVPASQYPFALLGWTGSRMFIRSIRDYSRKEKNMILTSHGLYDKTTNKLLTAKDEREIFQHLCLEYREPGERNC